MSITTRVAGGTHVSAIVGLRAVAAVAAVAAVGTRSVAAVAAVARGVARIPVTPAVRVLTEQ